jgi:hypothetical protein
MLAHKRNSAKTGRRQLQPLVRQHDPTRSKTSSVSLAPQSARRRAASRILNARVVSLATNT